MLIALFGDSACGVSLEHGIRERIDQALAQDGTTSEWSGVALTPSLIRFSCRQTGEVRADDVLRKIRDFRSKCTAYWPRPIGISRHEKKGRYGVWNAADVEHQVWLRTEQPMKDGETRAFALPDGLDKLWPIWRRYANVEIGAIRSAEFSVWKTIAPAAAVTGYLADYARRAKAR